MSEMLNRVAKAIQEVQEKPKYVVKIATRMSTVNINLWELWDDKECIKKSNIHSLIQGECDRLNALYTARKAVEALKGDVPYYETNKFWESLTSTEVWNLCLDKVLFNE